MWRCSSNGECRRAAGSQQRGERTAPVWCSAASQGSSVISPVCSLLTHKPHIQCQHISHHKMLLKETDTVTPCILLSIVSKSWKTFNPSQIIKDLKPLELLENQIREYQYK